MLKNFLFTLILFSSVFSIQAQRLDTIKVMHYNLLNYRNITNQCNEQTNNPEEKDKALDRIIWFSQPDIFTINEMGSNWLNPNKLLKNALNKSGEIIYDQAEFTNNSFSNLVNMLFFNTAKFALESQKTIEKDAGGVNLVRVIDIYRLYVKDTEALERGDTLFFNFVVAHLKAGSTSADKAKRADMTEALMTFLENKRLDENYIICGDFNIQSSNEQCYKNMTQTPSESIRFYDPIEAPGVWNNKSLYANLHTQSTRSSSTSGGCFSGGGLDDRFDFILVGKELLDNKNNARYIDDSYVVMGQDSRRFNGTILNPTNKSLPTSLSQALYSMSDHLPVVLNIEIGPVFASIHDSDYLPYSFSTSQENIKIWGKNIDKPAVTIYSINGKELKSKSSIHNEIEINISDLAHGIYILELKNGNGIRATRRFIVSEK